MAQEPHPSPYFQVILDPAAVAQNRNPLPLNENGIRISNAGIDWGDAVISAFMADMRIGSIPVDSRIPNRNVIINLMVFTDEWGNIFSVIKQALTEKVQLLQREGGTLQRKPGQYADIVNATLTFPDIYGESGEIETNVVLNLECLPDFYGDEIVLDSIFGSGYCNAVLTQGGVKNYIGNPSFEYDIVGNEPTWWTTSVDNATVSVFNVGNSWAASGTKSLDVEITDIAAGGYCEVVPLVDVTPDDIDDKFMFAFVANVLAMTAGMEVQGGVQFFDSEGNYISELLTPFITTTGVHSAQVINMALPGNTVTIRTYVIIYNGTGSTAAMTLQLDSLILSDTPNPPTYFDGDSGGFFWEGVPGNSTSSQSASIEGDYPGRVRIVVTDANESDQYEAIWGFRSRNYDKSFPADLIIPAYTMALGSGANLEVDDGSQWASGVGLVVVQSLVEGVGNGNGLVFSPASPALSHVGAYAIWARVFTTAADTEVTLNWTPAVGSSTSPNTAVEIPAPGDWYMINLGTVYLTRPPVGAPGWLFSIEPSYASVNGEMELDYVLFQPLDESAGFVTCPESGAYAGEILEIRSEGVWRLANPEFYSGTDSTGDTLEIYYPVTNVIGDLARIPPSGYEDRPVEIIVKVNHASAPFPASPYRDSYVYDYSIQVIYRPCWLFPF